MLLTCLLPFLVIKGSRVLEKKVNETQVLKTVFDHLKHWRNPYMVRTISYLLIRITLKAARNWFKTLYPVRDAWCNTVMYCMNLKMIKGFVIFCNQRSYYQSSDFFNKDPHYFITSGIKICITTATNRWQCLILIWSGSVEMLEYTI